MIEHYTPEPRGTFLSFAIESNAIEGIHDLLPKGTAGTPGVIHADALKHFVTLDKIAITDIEEFVYRIQRGAVLRDRPGLDVTVGVHRPPRGGPGVKEELTVFLEGLDWRTPFENHVRYETLHPFTDGNGRSGRAIWLWQMLRPGNTFNGKEYKFRLGFLHTWYYQSLDAKR